MPLEGATGWPGVGHKTVNNIHVPPQNPYPYQPPYQQPAAGPAALDAMQAQKIITDLEMIMQMLAKQEEQKQMPSAPPYQPQPVRPPPYAPQAYQQPYSQQPYPPYQLPQV